MATIRSYKLEGLMQRFRICRHLGCPRVRACVEYYLTLSKYDVYYKNAPYRECVTGNLNNEGRTMPTFQAEIQKSVGEEDWVNVYYLFAVDLLNAVALMADVIDIERNVHLDIVTFERLLVRDTNPAVSEFHITPLSGPGIRSTTSFQALPLFNCIRCDMGYGFGRLGHKFLRGCLTEGDQNAGALVTATVDAYQSDYADAINALAILTKEDGTELTNASIYSKVASRQLTRRKRPTPTP